MTPHCYMRDQRGHEGARGGLNAPTLSLSIRQGPVGSMPQLHSLQGIPSLLTLDQARSGPTSGTLIVRYGVELFSPPVPSSEVKGTFTIKVAHGNVSLAVQPPPEIERRSKV